MLNKSKMFLLSYFCWFCLFNSFLAYPLTPYKEPDIPYDFFSNLAADYPDLTRGLTDAEVQEALNDLTLQDLKSLDFLINEHINFREQVNRASLRSMQAGYKNFRAVYPPTFDDEENEYEEEPRQDTRCKPIQRPTTKRCMKTTYAPETSRTPKPDCVPRTTKPDCVSRTTKTDCVSRTTKPDCVPRTTKPDCVPRTTKPGCVSKTTTPHSSNDVFGKCPRVNVKNKRKKPQEDNECASDDFLCQARKRMENARNIFQEAPAKYTPPRELAGIEKIGEQIIPSLNDHGEPIDEEIHLDFPKESRLMEPSELHENVVSFEGEHQSHLENTNHKLQHESTFNLDHELNFERELGFNLKEAPQEQENFDNSQPDHWANEERGNLDNVELGNFDTYKWENLEQTNSDRMKLSNWAKLDPANLANIEGATFDNLDLFKQDQQPQLSQEHNDNFKLEANAKFQPAQAQQSKLQQENQNNFKQDNQASLKQTHVAKLQPGNQAIFEHENRANLQLQNQDSFEETHWNNHKADLNNEQLNHQDKELQSEVNFHESKQQLSKKRNAEQKKQDFIPLKHKQSEDNYQPRPQPLTNQAELHKAEVQVAPLEPFEGHKLSQENQALIPQVQTHREQRSNTEQWTPNQPLTNQAKLNKMEGETLNPYGGHQLYQKINTEIEKPSENRRAATQKKEQVIKDEPQPVKADLTKQKEHFEIDSFLAKSARDPPIYLHSMQNELIQREAERRLNQDRSLSESLNLDKLTGEKEASPAGEADWTSDNKRGKRENRSTDDAPENSRETYIKKLMDSFPRDQGSQINANVALKDCPFAHERMKRS